MNRRPRKPASTKKSEKTNERDEPAAEPLPNENGEQERPLPRWFSLADPLRPNRALLYVSAALFCAWIAFLVVLAWLA